MTQPGFGNIPPAGPLAYEGSVVVPFICKTFDPQTTFTQFPVPSIWVNTSTSNAWILVSKASSTAIWVLLGGASGSLDTITTPDSVVVVPTAGNINFLQSGSVIITGSGSDVTFDVLGGGITWNNINLTSASMLPNNGYWADNTSTVTLTLPATCAAGSMFSVMAKNTGGWVIAQNSGQKIQFGNVATTTGVSGSLASTLQGDVVNFVCTEADNIFQVASVVGDLTYV